MSVDDLSLEEKYIYYRWLYAIGSDEAYSDKEYNDLEEQMKLQFPESKYLKQSWSLDSCPIEILTKLERLDLTRNIVFNGYAESIPSLNSWELVESKLSSLNEPSRLSFKIDGWNVELHYYNGEFVSMNTRGRAGTNKDISNMAVVAPKSIPYMGMVTIYCEMNIRKDKWPELSALTGNKSYRSSVSTVVANGYSDYVCLLAFSIISDSMIIEDKYAALKECGFMTPHSMIVNNYTQLKKAVEIMSRMYKSYQYFCDGFVFESKNEQWALRVGAFEEEIVCSYVTGYIENSGMYGVRMLCSIEPVVVDGAKRSEVSVTNLQYIMDSNLRIGYPIAFTIRSKAVAVLNVTQTRKLQEEWLGDLDGYRDWVKSRFGAREE